jgi:hypothetical protein
MPLILATHKAEVRRIEVQSQPVEIVCEPLSRKIGLHKNRAGGVVQGVGSEFKPQHHTHTHTHKEFEQAGHNGVYL